MFVDAYQAFCLILHPSSSYPVGLQKSWLGGCRHILGSMDAGTCKMPRPQSRFPTLCIGVASGHWAASARRRISGSRSLGCAKLRTWRFLAPFIPSISCCAVRRLSGTFHCSSSRRLDQQDRQPRQAYGKSEAQLCGWDQKQQKNDTQVSAKAVILIAGYAGQSNVTFVATVCIVSPAEASL